MDESLLVLTLFMVGLFMLLLIGSGGHANHEIENVQMRLDRIERAQRRRWESESTSHQEQNGSGLLLGILLTLLVMFLLYYTG